MTSIPFRERGAEWLSVADRILFITGNEWKVAEARAILGNQLIAPHRLDLPEIQSLDPRAIIREKLVTARRFIGEDAALMVEDVSFWFSHLDFPGPLIKFVYEALGRERIVTIARALECERGRAECTIGLSLPGEEMRFFSGVVEGRIVDPRGTSGFGFDPIFLPDGHERTFAEMSPEEKNAISHRRKALAALRAFLEEKANL